MYSRHFFISILFTLFLTAPSYSGSERQSRTDYGDKITVELIMQSTTDIIGQDLTYSPNAPKITAAVIIVPPKVETGWHVHDNILVAYLEEGELTLDYGSSGIKVIKAGSAFAEAVKWPHNGKSTGTKPAKIIAFFIGDAIAPNSRAVEK